MDYTVKAECVDHRSGRRYKPGETFDPPPDKDQFERLKRAGVFGNAGPSPATDQGQRTDEGEARRREEDAAAISHPVRIAADQEADRATAEARNRAPSAPEESVTAPAEPEPASRETKPRRMKR